MYSKFMQTKHKNNIMIIFSLHDKWMLAHAIGFSIEHERKQIFCFKKLDMYDYMYHRSLFIVFQFQQFSLESLVSLESLFFSIMWYKIKDYIKIFWLL